MKLMTFDKRIHEDRDELLNGIFNKAISPEDIISLTKTSKDKPTDEAEITLKDAQYQNEDSEEWDGEKPNDGEESTEADSSSLPTTATQIEGHEMIDDSVRMYLREIGRVHLLTAKDERTLARQMEAGHHIESMQTLDTDEAEAEGEGEGESGQKPKASDVIISMLQRFLFKQVKIYIYQNVFGLIVGDLNKG